MKKRVLSFVFFVLSFALAVHAQTFVEAKAKTDKSELSLGDDLRYSIDVQVNGSLSQSPRLTPPEFEGFRIVGNRSSNSTSIINGKVTVITSIIYDLLAIKRGEITIPPAKVMFKNPTTDKYETIQTKPVTVSVAGGKTGHKSPTPTPGPANPQYSQIKEVKVKLDFRLSDILPYILLIVFFIGAVIFIARLIFKKQDAMPVQEDIDYRKESMRMLKKAHAHLKKGDIKGYYIDSYEAVRFFISAHFNESFEELTTREIIKKLRALKVDKDNINKIKSFMSQCDLVKFADYKPGDSETEADYIAAEEIINTIV